MECEDINLFELSTYKPSSPKVPAESLPTVSKKSLAANGEYIGLNKVA
jgi:hypothetical protein